MDWVTSVFLRYNFTGLFSFKLCQYEMLTQHPTLLHFIQEMKFKDKASLCSLKVISVSLLKDKGRESK